MQSLLTAKENLSADTPLLLFDCTLANGTVRRWSSGAITSDGFHYEGRVIRHNLFETQLASDTQVGGAPRLTFELANADSNLSEIEQQTGFKGARLMVRAVFADLTAGTPTTAPLVVFSGLMNPPDLITENSFRLSAMNRMATQRSVVPEVRIQRLCPWRFPLNAAQRQDAVNGDLSRGKFSPFYRCGYSADQPNGVGNLNGGVAYSDCTRSRSDCEQRGMFKTDSTGRTTARFGGVEYVPPTILVRGSGQKNYSLSAIQDNQARYNDFVPLVYGTQWHSPDLVFSRNDGNLTRMEVLLGMGEIQNILKVLVNNIEIPRGVSGANMTATGWYNLISPGTRSGQQDPNFSDAHGVPLGDPYGSMACLSVVVPNRVTDGTTVPSVQVLLQGLKLEQFDTSGNSLGEQFSDNPAWVVMDLLRRSGYGLDEIDAPSFARAAAYAGELITAQDVVGGHVQVPRFQCNMALKQRRSAGEVVRAIRNASRVYLVLGTSGKLEARVENTFALQQPLKPAGSNATNTFNGGWPAYAFDAASIARNKDGSASVRLSAKNAQDTPNRLSVEFQDSFNQYQQDSLSLSDGDDADLCGQEVAAISDAAGISSFHQAARMLLLGLNRGVDGNRFIEFETSVKALGLMPGDLITVTYPKENLQQTPFRILKISPGPSFRTAVISAQVHDDAWYSDSVTGIVGGRGWQSGQGPGLPAPVGGVIADSTGTLQLGVQETEVLGSDGSASVEMDVSFTAPSGQRGSLVAPLIGLLASVGTSAGTLSGGLNYFYAVSAVDSAGDESPLSFVVQAAVPAGNVNSVTLQDIGLPTGAAAFHVYRGTDARKLFRIASGQSPAVTFTDTGLPNQTILPPDPQFDHVNLYWRWEWLPETPATTHSGTTIGNSILRLNVNQYAGATVRITQGPGAGQERVIASNDVSTVTISLPWNPVPDASSSFVISESAWRAAASSPASPIPVTVPERLLAGLQLSARAANAANEEAAYDLSPFTRWTIGQSRTLLADSDVPPAPVFGVDISPTRGGVLDFGSLAFENLINTRSVIAGTYRIHYYDEIHGDTPLVLTTLVTAADLSILLPGIPLVSGTFIQIGREVLLTAGKDPSGNTVVQRGLHTTAAADYDPGTLVYILREKIAIVPFIRNFFGAGVSGEWKSSLELPGVRVASAEMYMTNAIGNGPPAAVRLTSNNSMGLRTLGGGQYSFQISGYLAIQTGAAPDVIVEAERAVGDIYAVLRTPAAGAGVTLQLNRNGAPYATIQFAPLATTSGTVSGFGLPPLLAGETLSLDITGVGTTNPGSDLTVIVRL